MTTALIGWSHRGPLPATSAAGGAAAGEASAAPIDPSVAAAAPTFLTRPLDRPAGAGLAGSIADESAAAALASRLAAIGMAQAPVDPGGTGGASATPGPLLGAPSADALAIGTPVVTSTAPLVDPSAPVRRMASPEDDIIGARVIREPGAGSELSRIIRLGTSAPAPDPRPVSSASGSRARGPEPREQPRRPEAYPTIRTRARVPRIPRAAFGAVALAAAAAFLFFVVPPLFVNDGAGGPGASGSPRPGASASVRPSRTPARSAAPSPRVYVVRSGDTLSTIAQRFGVTVDEILEANPEIKNPNQIGAGDRLVIPAKATATPERGGVADRGARRNLSGPAAPGLPRGEVDRGDPAGLDAEARVDVLARRARAGSRRGRPGRCCPCRGRRPGSS